MKTIIAGSRGIREYALVEFAVHQSGFEITEVICGLAPGPDSDGLRWADRNHVPVTEFRPDWDRYGNGAGYERNIRMVERADALVCLWDGQSKGTKHTLELAEKKGIPIYLLRIEGGFCSEVRISARNFF